jgi:hypothetical protein
LKRARIMQQKKNLMPGQAKNDDFDNDDDYYYQ